MGHHTNLQAVEDAMAASAELQQAAATSAAPMYLADPAAMQRAGADSWKFAPASAQSMLAISLAVSQPASGGLHTHTLLSVRHSEFMKIVT